MSLSEFVSAFLGAFMGATLGLIVAYYLTLKIWPPR